MRPFKHNGLIILLAFLFSGFIANAQNHEAADDYMQVLTCYDHTVLDVLLNDAMIRCSRNDIELTITNGSKAGATAAVNSGNNIVYTPVAGFIGQDTLEYRVVCNETSYSAKVFITVVECPDNISDPDCYGEPAGSQWTIREVWKSSLDVIAARSWVVGDLDGDGLPEIVAIRRIPGDNDENGSSQIVVFPGNDRDNPKIITAVVPYGNYEVISYMALGRVDDKGMIFVIGRNADRRIHAYEYPSGNRVWVSDQDITWGGNLPRESPTIGLADFNGDGIPEIYVGNKIFNAVDGKYICGAGSAAMRGFSLQNSITGGGALSVAVDIDGDGLPELVCGNEVYKVDIASKTMTLWRKITPPTIGGVNVANDGHISIADFNGDGFPDVLVSLIQVRADNNLNNARFVMYGWDVVNNEILFTCVQNNKGSKSVPFIGDIDGDGKPEVLVLTQAQNINDAAIYAYRLPAAMSATATLNQMWRLGVDEGWGRTGITLFDFNQDGKMEIVYRDMTRLRIIDGNGQDITTFPSTSATTWEYPIVVDVDGDGMAEIVCAGGPTSSGLNDGYMSIYKPNAGYQWAPARKVWNQYAYNAVNVNDDLTIPRYQMNPATFFPNGKQPFNAFLQQHTLLNTDGDPYWNMPNIVWETEPTATVAGDSVTLVGCIKNIGDAALQAPFYITFYKNDTIAANIIALDSIQEKLMAGSTLCFEFTVNNISAHAPVTSIWISINDHNGDYPYQTQCMVDGRHEVILEERQATDDYMQVLTCYDNTVLDVLLNDTMIHCSRNDIELTITNGSKAGATVTVNGDNNIVYIPAASFLGRDTLEYSAVCLDTAYTATVFITVVECPDNISDPDCYGLPVPQDWSMAETYSNENNLSPYQGVVVGDIDGDGIVEIIIAADPEEGNINIPGLGIVSRPASKIAIYKGNDIKSPPFVFSTKQVFTWDNKTRYGIVRTQIAAKDTVLIVVAEADRRLRAYNYNGQMVWESPAANPYHASLYNGMSPTFADLNHDGIPEIAIGGRLYNSTDGSFICAIPAGYTALSYTQSTDFALLASAVVQLVDVFNDGNMKYVMGNYIYDVNIDPATNVIQSLTLNKIITPPVNWVLDPDYTAIPASSLNGGAVLFVDMDKDGKLDMVVSVAHPNTNRTVLYVADPVSGNIKAAKYIASASHSGYPFVGDMDGDGNPEIALIKGVRFSASTYRIVSYKYVPGNPVLQLFWELPHSDASCVTGLTLFDFDQDGIAEIVYRDETDLRIIEGRATSPYPNRNKASMPNFSGTGAEYPVIADVDGDGQAEIIIVGSDNSPGIFGRLRVYKSANPGSSPWAPARKVWNQYAYQPVYVNEDLSIPEYPISPATVFPGQDGILGTADDVRPYNNFLQQQTLLNLNGDPYWSLPNIVWKTEPTATVAGDSVTFTGCITNTGDAALQAPFYITFYKNDTIAANIIALDSIQEKLMADSTLCFEFTVNNISAHAPVTSIWISINDRNGDYPYQAQCMVDGRREVILDKKQATDDYLQVLTCYPSTVLDILANDTMIECSRNDVELTITSGSKAGATATVNGDNNIVYTPAIGFLGRDTLEYSAVCVDTVYTATVFITVAECPDNISTVECYENPSIGQWNIEELMNSLGTGVEIDNSCIPLVGDIDNDGKTEIVVLGKAFHAQYSNKIHIFKVDNGALVLQQTLNVPVINRVNNPYAIANVDGNEYASLFFCTSHYAGATTAITNGANARQLMKYTYNPTTQLYEFAWKQTYSARTDREMGQPIIVDFNGDGISEVLVLDKVFNARTGALLVDGGHLANNNNGFGFGGHLMTVNRWVSGSSVTWSSIMAVGDIDGDGLPEVIGGKTVYKIAINNPNTQDGTNSFEILRHVDTTGHPEAVDGPTALADITGNGQLDVIVTGNLPGVAASSVYVWDPRTGQVLHNNIINNISRVINDHSASVPFIGDIDGSGRPSICLSGRFTTRAYSLDVSTNTLTQKWSIATNDDSSATGITMFDFDQSGSQKLVYRDMTHLRILNGVDGSNLIAPIECPSSTANEYPVVVDVNNDGAAEIVVTSGHDYGIPGVLRIYGSSSSQYSWAPARKVWNQYAYNVVNVNEDLTIPRYQMNPARFFPNGKQPFNAYLQQQTLLNMNGDPFWPLPNIVWESRPMATVAGDSVTITGCITNTGEATSKAPIYITFYKNDTIAANIIALDSIQEKLMVDSTLCFKFTVNNISAHNPVTSIWISINDRNGDYPYQAQCMVDGRREVILNKEQATDDYMQVLTCYPSTVLDILVNDTMISCSRNDIELTITSGSKAGATVTVNSDNNIVYTLAVGFIGCDTLEYAAVCHDTVYTAKVFITVVECPDNITEVDCYGMPPATEWGIKELYRSTEIVHALALPLVGDFDGCGKNEVIAFDRDDLYARFSNRLLILDDQLQFKTSISIPNTYIYGGHPISIADVDGDGKAEIFVLTGNAGTRTLRCFYYDGTDWVAKPGFSTSTITMPFTSSTIQGTLSISIGDINGDGIPELLVYDRIINSHTGVVIATLPNGSRGGYNIDNQGYYCYFPTLADVDNDGILEIVAGNMVYKAQINGGSTSGTVTLAYQAPAGIDIKDGFTSVADIDLDGYLDVVVTHNDNNVSKAYVWSPYKGTLLGQTMIGNSTAGGTLAYRGNISRAFIGDVDNDGYPEIAFSYYLGMVCYKYNPVAGNFVQLWRHATTDQSGSTTMSMFDFNQDGKQEIIYRDETHLRIMDGETGLNKNSISCYSGTGTEMPIVVDLTGEGYAQIVVSGASTSAGNLTDVRICSFESTIPGAWASARKVWNQYGYNVVNINEDLTVPRNQMNPATVFPNGKRPYNNFQQQQTLLNTNGDPFWTMPNIAWEIEPTATVAGDSVTITGCITNTGAAALQAPFYITFYKNDTIAANIIALDSIQEKLMADSTLCFKFTVNNISAHAPITSIWISINDRNGDYPYQAQCMVYGRRKVILDKRQAANDYMQVLTCYDNTVLDVLLNDTMINCSRNDIELTITSGSKAGATATVNGDNNIVYTPAVGFIGRDTLEYAAICYDTVYTAKVFITVVECPDNISDPDCYGAPEAFEWAITQEWQSAQTDIATYVSPIAGDLDGDGIPEIVVAKFHSYAPGLFRPFQNLYVYKGSDRSTPIEIPTPQGNYMPAGSIAMARVPINGATVPIVVMIDNLGYLRAYNPFKPGGVTNQNDYVWISNATVFASYNNSVHFGSVAFADFNNDGIPEIYVGNRIFDATTGKLLVDGPAAGNKGAINFSTASYQYMPTVADVDGDGMLEYIAGTQIYKVNIEQGTMTLLAEINPIALGGYTIKDGNTFVADINKDGYLDVIITAHLTGNTYGIAVWDIRTETVLATVTDASASTYPHQIGIPFIGDVDGDGELEILLTSMRTGGGYINGYRWNGASALERVYRLQTSDESGCTGITLFDFNQDGIMELVYRDMTHLRIMRANPGTGTFVDVATIPATSGTAFEYPIVIDANNDGAAEIVVTGGTVFNAYSGSLRIYKSGNQHTWAPARKVWNQYAYNVVNVNEDLTIPQYQMNPATVFPGPDGILGTADDVRPYNNFMQQQTLLNTNGDPYWSLPNITWETELTTTVAGDSVTFTGCITNTGSAVLQAPVYITFYKNDTIAANIIALDSIQEKLMVDSTLCFAFTVNDICTHSPITGIWISINDRNGDYPYQTQCMVDGRRKIILEKKADSLLNITICQGDSMFFGGKYYNQPGIYKDTIKTLMGCDSIATLYLTVQDSSLITLAPDNQYICQDGEQEITLTAKVKTGNPSEIAWYDDDRTPIEPNGTSSKRYVIPLDSESTYWAYAVDPVCGDSPYAYTTVYITNKIYLLLQADTNKVQMGDKVMLTVTPTNDEHGIYRWYDAFTGKLLGETTVNTFAYTLDRAEIYMFYVLTDNGYCPDAQSNNVEVEARDYYMIPDIITPYDRNGLNDTFMTPRDGKPGYRVEIYNRYQQKVFEGDNGWDGTYRGRLAEPGTYFFRIFMKDGRVMKGPLEVAKF